MGKFDSDKIKKKQKQVKADKEKQDKRSKSFVKSHKSVDGDNLFRFFEPKTDSDYPWEEIPIHYSCGPERKEIFRCSRDVADKEDPKFQPVSKCFQCKDNDAKWKSKKKSSIALAKRRGRKNRYLLEGINLTSLVDAFEEGDIPNPKKCFGNYIYREDDDGYKKCQKCIKKDPWGPVCSEGVGVLVIGPTIGNPLMDGARRIFKDIGNNPFSLKKGHNFGFSKTGKELNTDYSNIGFSLAPFKLPQIVIDFIKENRIDWKMVYPKITKEEMLAKMKGVEADIEDEDEDEDELEEEVSEDSEDEDVDVDEDSEDDDEDDDDEDENDDSSSDDDEEDESEDDEESDDEDEGDDSDSDEDDSDEDEDDGEDSDSDDSENGEGEDEDDEAFFEEIKKDIDKSKKKGSLEKKLNKEAKKKKKKKAKK